MKIIENTIFDGTAFAGIPMNFKYVQVRPKNIYKVKDDEITLHNYPKWIEYPTKETDHELRKLFLHDLCHAVLFYQRGKVDKILTNDFGMNWDNVKRFKNTDGDPLEWFKVHNHLIDEYKVSTLFHILCRTFKHKKLHSRKKIKNKIFDNTAHIWHSKNIYKSNSKFIDAVIKKKAHISEAVDFWYDIGLPKIEKMIKSMVKDLQPQE